MPTKIDPTQFGITHEAFKEWNKKLSDRGYSKCIIPRIYNPSFISLATKLVKVHDKLADAISFTSKGRLLRSRLIEALENDQMDTLIYLLDLKLDPGWIVKTLAFQLGLDYLKAAEDYFKFKSTNPLYSEFTNDDIMEIVTQIEGDKKLAAILKYVEEQAATSEPWYPHLNKEEVIKLGVHDAGCKNSEALIEYFKQKAANPPPWYPHLDIKAVVRLLAFKNGFKNLEALIEYFKQKATNPPPWYPHLDIKAVVRLLAFKNGFKNLEALIEYFKQKATNPPPWYPQFELRDIYGMVCKEEGAKFLADAIGYYKELFEQKQRPDYKADTTFPELTEAQVVAIFKLLDGRKNYLLLKNNFQKLRNAGVRKDKIMYSVQVSIKSRFSIKYLIEQLPSVSSSFHTTQAHNSVQTPVYFPNLATPDQNSALVHKRPCVFEHPEPKRPKPLPLYPDAEGQRPSLAQAPTLFAQNPTHALGVPALTIQGHGPEANDGLLSLEKCLRVNGDNVSPVQDLSLPQNASGPTNDRRSPEVYLAFNGNTFFANEDTSLFGEDLLNIELDDVGFNFN